MKTLTKYGYQLTIFLLSIVLFSCLGDFNELDKVKGFKWEPEVAFPLVNSTFNFNDFIENSSADAYVSSDQNGVITLIYDDGIISKSGASVFNIDNQNYQTDQEIPSTVTVGLPFADSIVYKNQINFDFSTEPDKQLDSAILKSAQLDFQANWNFYQPGKLVVTFKSLTQNSDTVRTSYKFNTAGPGFNKTINLSNAKLDLTDGGTTHNIFSMEVIWVIYNDGGTLPPTTNFSLNLQIVNPIFRAIFGDLGNETYNTNTNTTTFDIFDVISSGTFELTDPKAIISIDNTFGVSSNFFINNLWVENNSGTIRIQGSITDSLISAPGITYDELGTSKVTQVEVNTNNSNIADLMKDIPHSITYQFNGSAYGGSGEEFVLDTSHVNIDLKIELPLEGKIQGLTAEKEYTFDGSQLTNVKNASLQIQSVNEFPLYVQLQIFFLDDSGTILDTFFGADDLILDASQNNPDGTVVKPGAKTFTETLTQEKIKNISEATQIRMEAIFNSAQNGTVPVTILDSQEITFTIGIMATLDPTNN